MFIVSISYFFIFAFGAIVGSFINVVVLRYNTGQSIISGRSKCFNCGKDLRWPELIPIASFFLQKAKCKGCRSKISWQYPIVETLTGLIFLLTFNFHSPFSTLYFLIIFSLLIIIAVYDYHHQMIPNLFVWIFNGMAFAGLFGNWSASWRIDQSGLLAGFILFIFFASLWLVSRGRWMGFGDAKLALGIGWLLGLANGAAAVTLAFWIGAIVGGLLIFLSRKKYSIKSNIAFGPFLVIGAFIAFLFGDTLVGILF